MRTFTTRLPRLLALCSFFFAPASRAADGLEFELQTGSTILDDCRDCDRIPFLRPLAGTLVLTDQTAGETGTWIFRISDIDLRSPDDEYVVTGEGTYTIGAPKPDGQTLALDVEVNEASGVRLESAADTGGGDWPLLDLTATEDGSRDPLHVYSIRLIASPRVPMTRYELQEGSTFLDECLPCARPTIPVPIEGTFLLGEIEGGANPIVSYRVDAVDFRSVSGPLEYGITGSGLYRQGGEVALLQDMKLLLEVNKISGTVMASDRVTVPRLFPEIEIQLEHVDPPTDLDVYTLHIVASPVTSAPPEFRRGDCSGDGTVDISDAIFSLGSLFLGQGMPGCDDACDSNDDAMVDISDAITTLGVLFLGNGVIPPPGMTVCGVDPTADDVGCGEYRECR